MLYFLVRPNYQTLSNYITFPDTPTVMEQNYGEDGYAIVIDWYYTDEQVEQIDQGFKAILNKYNLQDHYDNLLFLSLAQLQIHETILQELNSQFAFKTRAKELAQLLLAFEESTEAQLDTLTLKTLLHTPKIKDPKLLTWIGSLIKEAVKTGNVPYTLLGLESLETTEDWKRLASEKLVPPAKTSKKPIADFCLSLYPYLLNETDIRPNESSLISDNACNFFFDLLVLFDLIKPESIESEPKDYINSLLRYRIRN